jgi:hypothetical protein
MVLALAASFTAHGPSAPQAPAIQRSAGTVSQESAKPYSTVSSSTRGRKIPCKTPENAAICYWAHGRLSIYEGTVPYRIWKTGTRRMLGVFSGPSHYPALTDDDVFQPELPPELDRAYESDNRRLKRATGISWARPPPVFADFEICPLRPEIKGERQPVCIESAKNIFIQSDH